MNNYNENTKQYPELKNWNNYTTTALLLKYRKTKKCQQCQKPFYDNTKSNNRQYCSAQCRDTKENQRAKPRHSLWHRIHKHLHKPTLGTITEQDLNHRTRQLIMRYNLK